jgi:hypothetical protein
MATKKSTKKGATKKGAKKAGTKSKARKGSSKAGTSDFLGSIISVFGGRTRRPKMSEQTRGQLARGNGIAVSVSGATTSFDSLVKELGRRLIIDPDRVRPRGCAPCHSGLDFILIGPERVINPVIEQLQRQEFG